MLNQGGYEIPEWRIESNEKQLRFISIMTGIVTALSDAGHKGWRVEHVVDSPKDVEYNAGLRSYYGTCSLININDMKLDAERVEGFKIVLWMSEKRGEKDRKGYFSVSYGDLEQYRKDLDEHIKVGIDVTKSPERIAAELIRRIILPARVERAELIHREYDERERIRKVEDICQSLHLATDKVMYRLPEQRMQDKNCGAELRYYIHNKVNADVKVSHSADCVDITLQGLTPEQAEALLILLSNGINPPASKHT